MWARGSQESVQPPSPTCPSMHSALSFPARVHPAGLQLERNEVIALFNFLERLAKAVEVVRVLSLQVGGGLALGHY